MISKSLKFFFSIHHFLITVIVAGLFALLSLIPFKGDFLNPIDQALSDFELTDIVFSQLRDPQSPDTSIVIVNIGEEDEISRARIAKQIFNLNRFEPKVIGIDAFFRSRKDSTMDAILQAAFATTSNLVLVSKLNHYNEQSNTYDTLETSNPELFMPFASSGFANLITEGIDEFRTSRAFSPIEKVYDTSELAFPLQVALKYDPSSVEEFLNRRNTIEYINYRGNMEKFYVIDVDQSLDEQADLSFVKDKIVIMGYMGRNLSHNTWGEDKFFTPLNKKFAGKSFPDMYGIVVHANIISMVLNKNYIEVMPEGLSFVILYFNVVIFSYLLRKMPLAYGAVTILWQLIVTILLLFVVLMLFNYANYKADFTTGIIAVLLAADICDVYFSFAGITRRTTKPNE
jgi:CHASE2 domain-containing sensor protein